MAKFNHIDVRGTKKVPSAFGNVFISADSISAAKTVTFPDGYLNGATPEPNLAFKVVFANGHNAANASSYLSLNGVVVVSNQNGTLAPLPIHEMTEGGSTVYKVLNANTALELYYTEDYDGNSHPAFVIVGNPLVLSSNTYSIYADGQNEKMWFPDYAHGSIFTASATSYTCVEDCYINFHVFDVSYVNLLIDGVIVTSRSSTGSGVSSPYLTQFSGYAKKGSVIKKSDNSNISTTQMLVFRLTQI